MQLSEIYEMFRVKFCQKILMLNSLNLKYLGEKKLLSDVHRIFRSK